MEKKEIKNQLVKALKEQEKTAIKGFKADKEFLGILTPFIEAIFEIAINTVKDELGDDVEPKTEEDEWSDINDKIKQEND